MARSVLVVVDGDAWVHRGIASGFAASANPIDVVPCTTARGALNACCALEPDCVVTELTLADESGLWLTSALRQQPSRLGTVPIVMTSPRDDEEVRLRALRGGVDVFVGKPFAAVELCSQVRALVSMAARLREQRSSSPVLPAESSPDGHKGAIVGDLNRMSVATVLAALELERRSGDLVLKGGRAPGAKGPSVRLVLNVAEGALVGAWRGDTPLTPLDGLRAALRWPGRRFEFVALEDRRLSSSAGAGTIGALVLEALRLDEAELAASAAPASPREPRQRIRSGTVAKMPATGGAPGIREAVAQAPGRRLVESVVAGPRPDPRAEPLELDLESEFDRPAPPILENPAELAAGPQRTRSAAYRTTADRVDEDTTTKMHLGRR